MCRGFNFSYDKCIDVGGENLENKNGYISCPYFYVALIRFIKFFSTKKSSESFSILALFVLL